MFVYFVERILTRILFRWKRLLSGGQTTGLPKFTVEGGTDWERAARVQLVEQRDWVGEEWAGDSRRMPILLYAQRLKCNRKLRQQLCRCLFMFVGLNLCASPARVH